MCTDLINDYRCICPVGFAGQNCEIKKDDCGKDNPCLNGGSCRNSFGSYVCDCPLGFNGRHCENNINDCDNNSCKHGRCVDRINSFKCDCFQGWTGSLCDRPVDDCRDRPCQNGGHCEQLSSGYRCRCPLGFSGLNCETNIDECLSNPCIHGKCTDGVNRFYCQCEPGYTGYNCDTEINECASSPCKNGGSCTDIVAGFKCHCPRGYYGPTCASDVNECASNPCFNGATCENGLNEYICKCSPGFEGRRCQDEKDFCKTNPCQHGGFCTRRFNNYTCTCPEGYRGFNCEENINDCLSSPCKNGGSCIDLVNDFKCACDIGYIGKTCEIETGIKLRCSTKPCHHGRCIDHSDRYECSCDPEWRGKNCDIFDKASPGGTDQTNSVYQNNKDPAELQKCVQNNCQQKRADNRCDEECNTNACDYDGGDCRIGFNPWKNCNVTLQGGKNCWDVFKDQVCDVRCNIKECFYDGLDCEDSKQTRDNGHQCDKHFDAFCSDHFGDGTCDPGCNTAACGWDGLDCVLPAENHKIIPGSLHVVLAVPKEQFTPEKQKRFVRYLSLVMKTNFQIKKDSEGQPMIYDYTPNVIRSSEYAFRTNLIQASLGSVVYLEVDNAKCTDDTTSDGNFCIDDIKDYSDFFSQMVKNSKETSEDWGIVEVGFAKGEAPLDSKETYGIAIGLGIFAFIVIAIGVIVRSQKKAKGVTWFPEGFFQTSQPVKRKCDGQEMLGFGHPGSRFPSSDGWSDDDPMEQPTKKAKHSLDFNSGGQTTVGDNNDGRQWTQHHLNAAGNVGMLTPPQAENFINDVDVKGPMGMTPLMIASMRGGGLDSGEFETFDEDETTHAVIQDLLSQGANIQAQMDKTGESPLHLAARFARADAAKKLLDASADANAQDHSGRTPLHAAIATDAQGVFHILLKNRATNLNAKTFDGTTPLILAARLAIEGVVEQLIEAEVDVNCADEQGKTALHWAASVNNVDAVNVLLAHGANRDAQDNKDETPLFLAAREGSYQAARALLDHCANRDIQDHMDRLPIQVAHEHMHQDIAQLLETYTSPAPPMTASFQNLAAPSGSGFPGSPTGQTAVNMMSIGQPMNGTKQRPKKRAKANSPNGMIDQSGTSMMNGTLPKNSAAVARKQSFKQKRGDDMLDNSPYSEHIAMSHAQMHYKGANGPLAMSHANYEDLKSKQPPSYEAAVSSQQQHSNGSIARSMQNIPVGMPAEQNLKGYADGQPMSQLSQQQQQQQQQQLHNRQQSMPASVSSYSSHLSPPHSNLSQHLQSPPPSNSLSPSNHGIMMSPPQSVQSNHTMSPPSHHGSQMMSPPQLYIQQQQQQSSPTKPPAPRSAQLLPTSPTHMAAMRGATHQKMQQAFDFNNVGQYGQQFNFPNQTNIRSDGFFNDGSAGNFMTPSPDSPGQWSSGSPQSHIDWSDGMLSPPSSGMNQFQHLQLQQQQQQQQHMAQHQMLQQQQQQRTDSVLI